MPKLVLLWEVRSITAKKGAATLRSICQLVGCGCGSPFIFMTVRTVTTTSKSDWLDALHIEHRFF